MKLIDEIIEYSKREVKYISGNIILVLIMLAIILIFAGCGKPDPSVQIVEKTDTNVEYVQSEYETTLTPCSSNKKLKSYVLKLTNGELYVYDKKRKIFLDVTNHVDFKKGKGCYEEL